MSRNKQIEHLDANETLFFLRDLEHRDPKRYEQLFAALLGRKFVPLIEGIPEWATSHRYKMYEVVGQAGIISPDTSELETVNVIAREVQRNIKSIGVKFRWTVDEIKAAAATQTPLDDFTVMSAMSAAERQADSLLAIGNSSYGIEGLLNHTGIGTTTAITKAATGITWAVATAAELIADVRKMLSELRSALAQASTSGGMDVPAFDRFTTLVPTAHYTRLSTMPRSDNSDTTVLAWILQNIPQIDAIEEWSFCDSVGGQTEVLMYPRNPLCVGGILNQEFTQHAPQAKDLNIEVPCQMKCGGTLVRYPVACRKMMAT